MAKEDNLTPFKKKEYSDKTVEIARQGGIASGIAKRKKKQLKEELELLLEMTDKNNKTIQEKICFALIKKASEGDTKAFEIVRDTIGQTIQQKVQVENVPVIRDDI